MALTHIWPYEGCSAFFKSLDGNLHRKYLHSAPSKVALLPAEICPIAACIWDIQMLQGNRSACERKNVKSTEKDDLFGQIPYLAFHRDRTIILICNCIRAIMRHIAYSTINYINLNTL